MNQQLGKSDTERKLIETLLNSNQRAKENSMKSKLITNLSRLHDLEVKELKKSKVDKIRCLELSKEKVEHNLLRINKKIVVLEEELKILATEKMKKNNQHSLQVLDIESQLNNLEKSLMIENDDQV